MTAAGAITEIIDVSGDGAGNQLGGPHGVAVDAAGNVYVAGYSSDNVFRVSPAGVVTEILDATGDGAGNPLVGPYGVAVDAAGNVYVTGNSSDNVFRVSPAGAVTEIIDSTGDGTGHTLEKPYGVATDAAGNVYVAGYTSDNVFRVSPAGVVTEIIDATGDGAGNPLDGPFGVATDGAGNVYVTGLSSDNVFRVSPAGVVTEIIDSTGDGAGNPLDSPYEAAVDAAGNVYVTGSNSNNVFRVSPAGVVTEIIDSTGDGAGNQLASPFWVAVDSAGNVFVTGASSDNLFRIREREAAAGLVDVSLSGGGLVDPVVTATLPDGSFSFDGLLPGAYTVTVTPPSGYSLVTSLVEVTVGVGEQVVAETGQVPIEAGESETVNAALSFGLIELNSPPVIEDQGLAVDENSAPGVVVGSIVASDPDVGDVVSFSVTGGTGAGLFAVSPAGVVSVAPGAVLDFESVSSYGLDVLVTDSAGEQDLRWSRSGERCERGAWFDQRARVQGHQRRQTWQHDYVLTRLIDSAGDGAGNVLSNPHGVATDADGNVYVTGYSSNNVFRVSTLGVITRIIDATGDGAGNPLGGAEDVAVDAAGNVYVSGGEGAFRCRRRGSSPNSSMRPVTAQGTRWMFHGVSRWTRQGNVYVSGFGSNNVFRISPGRVITPDHRRGR
ncbi:MAG: SBBP repeat-containing protein [Ilumatobacteraceae bacterium]